MVTVQRDELWFIVDLPCPLSHIMSNLYNVL